MDNIERAGQKIIALAQAVYAWLKTQAATFMKRRGATVFSPSVSGDTRGTYGKQSLGAALDEIQRRPPPPKAHVAPKLVLCKDCRHYKAAVNPWLSECMSPRLDAAIPAMSIDDALTPVTGALPKKEKHMCVVERAGADHARPEWNIREHCSEAGNWFEPRR